MRGKASGSVTIQKLSCPGRRESVSPAATTSKEACIGFETRMLFSVFSEISASHCSIRHPVKRDTAEKMIPEILFQTNVFFSLFLLQVAFHRIPPSHDYVAKSLSKNLFRAPGRFFSCKNNSRFSYGFRHKLVLNVFATIRLISR